MPRHDLSVGALVSAAGVAAVFLAVALAGIALTREAGNVSVFWPANGILAGLLLRMRRERHLVTIVGCFFAGTAANLLYGDPLGAAAGLAACGMLEAVLACHLIVRLVGPIFIFLELRQLLVLFLAGLAAPVISATIAAGLLSPALGIVPGSLWRAWWTRDAVGMILVLPLIASFDARPLARLLAGPRDRQLILGTLELGAAFGLLGTLLWLIVQAGAYGSPTLFIPILLWVALRFGATVVAAAALIIAVTAVTTGVHEAWPLPFTPGSTAASNLLPLQLFISLVTVSSLIVAVLVDSQRRTLRRLDDALESMADALALYDSDGRLVICNRLCRQYLNPVPDLLDPGMRFEDLVREGTSRDVCSATDVLDPEAPLADVVRAQNAGREGDVRYSDGRWLQVIPRPAADGGTVVVCRDITERKLMEQSLKRMAMHDPLTDLPNRKIYDIELRRARARAQRDGHRLCLMLLDLDSFKEVNDTYGHHVGDQLLLEVARRLSACVRAGDVVARIGGDEFAVLAENPGGAEGFEVLAERILRRLGERVQVCGIELESRASLGLTVFPDDAADLDGFVAHADRALYAAKEAGGQTWRLFQYGMAQGNGGSEPFVVDLEGALARCEFDLDYQPILAISSSDVIGIEALLRWNHPRRGRLPAGGFITAAERTPAIIPLTRFALGTALRQQRAWREAGIADVPVWVNLAPNCLRSKGLIDAVRSALADAGVAPNRLVLEVTEGSFVNMERAEGPVSELRRLGIGLALDDFGADYSSLGRLRALPMDVVKIDRSFIRDLALDERDRAVVRAMVTLGENLGLTPLAEGVETNEQLQLLQSFGCVWAQGYLFARPMPPQELTSWLTAWNQRSQCDTHDDQPEILTEPGLL